MVKKIVLTQLREEKGWSKSKLSHRAELQPNVIGMAESGRYVPYRIQLEKMANALDYAGDPDDLLKEVCDA